MNPLLSNKSRRTVIIIIIAVIALLILIALSTAHTNPTNKPIAKTAPEVENKLNDALPIQTPDYRIDYNYSQATKQFAYTVTLYAIINRPSEYDSYVAQLKQFKTEALNYISTHGGDPSKLTIQYEPPLAATL